MRRITVWLLSTVAAVVLLFSYRTSTMGAGGPNGGVASGGIGAAYPAAGAGTSGGSGTGSGTGTTAAGAGGGDGSYNGSIAQTRWGPVQVSITVANGRITSVAVPVYPNNNRRDEEINSYALPILQQETISAQNASIDTVSGATVTSDGYKESLQAALDAAHLS